MVLSVHASAVSARANIDELALVHIHTTVEIDVIDIDIECVATENMVVHQRAQEIVCRGNGVQIAREMQVDVRHGHYLRVTATRCTAFNAEHRSE